MEPTDLLFIEDICNYFRCSRSSVTTWINDPESDFPKPKVIGGRRKVWHRAVLESWLLGKPIEKRN